MEDIDGGLHPAVDGQSLDEMRWDELVLLSADPVTLSQGYGFWMWYEMVDIDGAYKDGRQKKYSSSVCGMPNVKVLSLMIAGWQAGLLAGQTNTTDYKDSHVTHNIWIHKAHSSISFGVLIELLSCYQCINWENIYTLQKQKQNEQGEALTVGRIMLWSWGHKVLLVLEVIFIFLLKFQACKIHETS